MDRESCDVVNLGPPKQRGLIPTPPKLNVRNYLVYVGPSIIGIAFGIGGGELVLGPLTCIRFGEAILWIATLSALFQAALNLELIRYTIVTGESITIGFMRVWPGPRFYAVLIPVLILLQLGWPYLAFLGGEWIAMVQTGLEEPPRYLAKLWGYLIWFLCIVIVLFGGKILKILEAVSWVAVLWIIVSMFIYAVLVVPPEIWFDVMRGFFSFGTLPTGVDWLVIGGLAGYVGLGGVANLALSHWYKDKGFGAGMLTGYIPSLIGGRKLRFSSVGIYPSDSVENIKNFKTWFRWACIDQWIVFVAGALVSMYLPCVVFLALIPRVEITTVHKALATLAAKAKDMFGLPGLLWVVTIVFWVWFSSQISVVDFIPRTITEICWALSHGIQRMFSNDVRKLYYLVMALYITWGTVTINFGPPGLILIIAGNIANLAFFVIGVLSIYVNLKLLNRWARPSPPKIILMTAASLFYLALFTAFVLSRLGLV